MPETSDRERSIAGYGAVVRGFHVFFGVVLIVVAVLHLFILVPFLELRTTAPALSGALARAEGEVAATDEAQQAIAAATAALVQFRRAMEAAPVELRRTIGNLVARVTTAGGGGDPYKGTVRVPKEGVPVTSGSADEEAIRLDEAIRRQIGRQTETLGLALDAAFEPLRSLRNPPAEVQDALRTAQESLGRNVLVLNEVLQEAFGADPNFWQRLNGPGATFAPASPRAAEWARGTDEALSMLERRLAAAAVIVKSRLPVLQERVRALGSVQRASRDRLAAFVARLAWMPLGLNEWARLYPLVAGALALTVLFRLRRVLLLRRPLAGIDLDAMAPSWIIGPPAAPGRWWALILVALPFLATLHAAVTVLGNPGLFADILGDPNVPAMIGFGAAYAALIGAGIWQLLAVTRATY
ncbi:MAG: hypothetical protein ACT4P5_00825 [Armatimonadota bacterium]